MARCRYKTRPLVEEWVYPLDALPGEEYCYWHKEEDGKEPTEAQLEELKEREIWGVYLQEADLSETNLQETVLAYANLREANLYMANLQWAYLSEVNLQGANLCMANLEGANLSESFLLNVNLHMARLQKARLCLSNFHESDLSWANLQEADLHRSHLPKANLSRANLLGADLSETNLQGVNLYGARFNSKTFLDGSVLIGANLSHSYFDAAKSFRNAKMFQNGGDREINEIIGDALACWFVQILVDAIEHPKKAISDLVYVVVAKVLKKKIHIPLFPKPFVLDMKTIEKEAPAIAVNRHVAEFIRYAGEDGRIIFFDWSSGGVIENPENWRRHERILVRVEELTDLILRDGMIQPEFIYKESRASLYEASYEVYNNLYNFYIANGRLDQAAHVHYRRGEVHRKLRWARGGWKNWTGLKYKTRSIFDLVILRTLTGYGDKIARPIGISVLVIGLFAALFWHFDGIVKNVNGTQVTPDWVDYLYHSITTFTSLGYSNIQPNLAAGHLPQILVAAESGLGVLMMVLIIFVVTYQVSR
jgi:uncharacterized protein YjbI with pentapeptide repeats